MEIRYADRGDIPFLLEHDRHIASGELADSITRKRVYIGLENGEPAAWLRYSLFWGNTPFMDMLYLLESCRGKGCGRMLAEHWEKEMAALGYDRVLTSTSAAEEAQHFYRKLGYREIGGFDLPGEPRELILMKSLLTGEAER